jgi:hypothetical protein
MEPRVVFPHCFKRVVEHMCVWHRPMDYLLSLVIYRKTSLKHCRSKQWSMAYSVAGVYKLYYHQYVLWTGIR